MTKLVYLDCPTGIAGDMCLGALVDAGVPLNYLQEKLAALGNAREYELWAELVHRNGQQATKVHVDLTDEQPHHHHHHDHAPTRHLPEIERMILGANLPTKASEWSVAVFRRLAEAEGAVHGIAAEKVHFHEVGATDAIVDIVGTCLGLDWLGVDRIYCSALPTGGGTIRAAHGRLPVPPPAVLKLFEMRQVPIYSNGIEREMVTPTGAAIATTLATDFGSPPAMTLHKVGLGAGSKDLPLPNILRLWIGEDLVPKEKQEPSQSSIPQSSLEEISVLETQIDDLSPQAIAYVYDRLLEAGALDVFSSAIAMKKSRLGILLTVICHPQHLAVCEDILFRETTTLGIRRLTQQRAILQRQIQPVQTQYGTIRVKIAWRENPQIPTNIQPEYEDCAALAKAHNVPWREIHDLALEAWKRKL